MRTDFYRKDRTPREMAPTRASRVLRRGTAKRRPPDRLLHELEGFAPSKPRTLALDLWIAVVMVLPLLSAGCRSTQPSANAPVHIAGAAQQEPVYAFLPAAHVVRINEADGYVLLECTVLPSPGEEAKVYRGQEAVAELVTTSRQRGPFVIADKVSGDVKLGDMVKFRCVVAGNPEEVAP